MSHDAQGPKFGTGLPVHSPKKPAARKASPAKKKAPPRVAAEPAPEPVPELKFLSIDELRAAYVNEVGCTTKSTDRNYLTWKIRQARQGKVSVGPVSRTRSESAETRRVLPLRMHADTNAISTVWRDQGLSSRMAFFRAVLDADLTSHGEDEAAALVRR